MFDIRTINLAELGRRFSYKRGQPRHTKVMKDAVQKLQHCYVSHQQMKLEAASQERTLAHVVARAPAQSLERQARLYFDAWNAHDMYGMAELMCPDVVYQDWEHQYVGWPALAASEAATFATLPQVNIDLQRVHVSEQTMTVVAEFLVQLNNTANDVSNGVYVITFNPENKIAAVRAYKG